MCSRKPMFHIIKNFIQINKLWHKLRLKIRIKIFEQCKEQCNKCKKKL